MLGVVIAFAIPRKVDCGFPGGECRRAGHYAHESCVDYEVEPWGFYLIEYVAGRDIGFAYSTGEDCH